MINSYLEQAQLNVEQQLINAELEKLEQYLNSNAAPAVRCRIRWRHLVEAHCRHQVPRAHLTHVFVTNQAGWLAGVHL